MGYWYDRRIEEESQTSGPLVDRPIWDRRKHKASFQAQQQQMNAIVGSSIQPMRGTRPWSASSEYGAFLRHGPGVKSPVTRHPMLDIGSIPEVVTVARRPCTAGLVSRGVSTLSGIERPRMAPRADRS